MFHEDSKALQKKNLKFNSISFITRISKVSYLHTCIKCQSKNFIAQVKIYPQKFILEQKDDLSNKWLEYPYLRIFMMSASASNSSQYVQQCWNII